jgi:hypothetical protein
MKYLSDSYYDHIESQFIEIENNYNSKIEIAKLIIEKIEEIINDMFFWLKNYTFECSEVEIHFFKNQKPRIISKLIYNIQIIEIESNLPSGKVAMKKFFATKIQYYNLLNEKNITFFQYYRANKTNHDAKFFIRKLSIKKIFHFDGSIINLDNHVSTTHDYLIALLTANDLIIKYLEDKIENIHNKKNTNQLIHSQLKWTGNKIELVELIYALQLHKSINYGNSDIKELAIKFGQMFGVEIEENIYRSYLDIKNRKIERTKFLNTLSENLNFKISEEDNFQSI